MKPQDLIEIMNVLLVAYTVNYIDNTDLIIGLN